MFLGQACQLPLLGFLRKKASIWVAPYLRATEPVLSNVALHFPNPGGVDEQVDEPFPITNILDLPYHSSFGERILSTSRQTFPKERA